MYELGIRRPRLLSAPDDGGGADEGGDDKKPPEGDDKKADDGKSQEGDEGELPQWVRDKLKKANGEAAKYRTQVRDLEPLAKKAKELEDAGKSDLEKAQQERDEAKSRADKAEATGLKLEVALEKAPDSMPVAKVRAMAKRLVGSTREELEADAEELFAEITGEEKPASKDGKKKPRESLRGGSNPERDDDDEDDPRKLAGKVARSSF